MLVASAICTLCQLCASTPRDAGKCMCVRACGKWAVGLSDKRVLQDRAHRQRLDRLGTSLVNTSRPDP